MHPIVPALTFLACLALRALAGGGPDFRPLFDGKTLKGWHIEGAGSWRIENGALIGTHAASDNRFGHLVSDSAYRDFTFRYRWKLVKGNSGLFYHSTEGGSAGMIGPQVEMDGAYPGGIYATNIYPWGWVVQPKSEDVPKWFRPNDWNLVTVTAQGAKVTVAYNGLRTAETSDPRLPAQGYFGFQVHANLDCEIWVKEVELALPAPVSLAPARDGLARETIDAGADAVPGIRDVWWPGFGNGARQDALGRYRTTIRSGKAPPFGGLSK
jgi:hypothetical protein